MMYSSVKIGSTSQSRLVWPKRSGSYQRPSSSTAKLAFQFFEMAHATDGITARASEESCGCRRRFCAKMGRPKDQTVLPEVSASNGRRWNKPSKWKLLLKPRLKSCRDSV